MLALLLVLLALAPAASADSIPVRDDPAAVGVALAGPDIVVAREYGGTFALVAVPRMGGPARTLLSVPGGSPPEDALTPLSASPRRVAAIVQVRDEYRVYSGPPAGPLRPVSQRGWVPVIVDADGDRVLVTEEHGSRARSEILGAGRITWASRRLTPVAIAGDYAAAVSDTPSLDAFVVDLATGAERAAVGWQFDDLDLDLGPDGQLVQIARAGVASVSPGAQSTILPGSGGFATARLAGSAVVGVDKNGVPVRLNGDATTTPLGPASRTLAGFDADADGVAWVANGCVRYAPVAAGPSHPAACPETEVGLYAIADSHLHGATARTIVICVAAADGTCRGTVYGKVGGRVAARGRFAVPAGTKRWVRMRVDRAARATIRRRGWIGMIVDATVPHGRVGEGCCGDSELTVYVSRSRRG
jgi:hypothetical protein